MKKLILSLLLVTALTACKEPASTIAYQTLATIGATENSAMKAAALAKKQGTITPAQWQSVADKHALFLVSYNAAVDGAAVALDKASVPANVAALEGDVLNLVTSFNIKF